MTWNRILPLQYTPTKTNKKKTIHTCTLHVPQKTYNCCESKRRKEKENINCLLQQSGPSLKLLNWPNSLLLLTAQLSRTRLAAQTIQTTTNFQSEKQSTPAAADAAAKICINTLQKYSPPPPHPCKMYGATTNLLLFPTMQNTWHCWTVCVSESGKSACGTDAWRADAKQNICRGSGKLEGFAG